MLELDHVLCFVEPGGDWAARATAAGWTLGDGRVHEGQGTRNRTLAFAARYLELIWVYDRGDAARNPVRLDRRAEWRTTGASPFGFGLRGQLPDELRDAFWAYQPPYSPGFTIWIHGDNERAPERPLVFVMEIALDQMASMRQRTQGRLALREVRLFGPHAPPPVPGLGVHHEPRAAPRLELVVGERPVELTELVAIR
ncbi:MAG TPA: VOC family protein [Kofleriaceae bacterium]|nr:VOC family protein [Kofleriaceae bacterium]